MSARHVRDAVLITGGAGFIGTNLAHHLAGLGRRVLLYDNLGRPGVERNLRWLQQEHPGRIAFEPGDVLDGRKLRSAVNRCAEIFHLAAQVAVTTSLESPVQDFEINARGTLNVLEAVRKAAHSPALVFTSTNKVYGALSELPLRAEGARYTPEDPRLRSVGIDENRSLDFHSPYGCSKGAADQYVLDYARCFGLRTVVFRMSCIYGPHQLGNEDQGWVAHFLIGAISHRPLTVFGDGRQVRDVLYVGDLVEALTLAAQNVGALSGEAFNIGGGPENTISLLELLDVMRERHGLSPHVQFAAWRNGDQRYYVSDPGKFSRATGWRPRVPVSEGIGRLHDWLIGEASSAPAGAASEPAQATLAAGEAR